MQKISTCLWFDTEAEEAAKWYTSIFQHSTMRTVAMYPKSLEAVTGKKAGTVMTAEFEIEGQHVMALNGGPAFHINQSISFFIHCTTAAEVDEYWAQLGKGGKVLMELQQYPFSKRYGWIQDKYGVSWQVILVDDMNVPAKIVPSLLFVGKNFGKAQEAVNHYLSVFPDAKVTMMNKAPPGPPYNNAEAVAYAAFNLCGEPFTIMDGPGKHAFAFSEGVSFVINCENQEEVDHYWEKLTADGGEESMCGWLKDKYGVSWQVTPTMMSELMRGNNPEKQERAMAAMLKMKKLDIHGLKNAAEQKG